jgi:hypothetical protein
VTTSSVIIDNVALDWSLNLRCTAPDPSPGQLVDLAPRSFLESIRRIQESTLSCP